MFHFLEYFDFFDFDFFDFDLFDFDFDFDFVFLEYLDFLPPPLLRGGKPAAIFELISAMEALASAISAGVESPLQPGGIV